MYWLRFFLTLKDILQPQNHFALKSVCFRVFKNNEASEEVCASFWDHFLISLTEPKRNVFDRVQSFVTIVKLNNYFLNIVVK